MGHVGRLTLLVTGAGGAATPTLIEHLRHLDYRVVAVDADSDAVGLRLADAGYVVPRGNVKSYLSAMRQLCQRENISAVIPLCDEELLPALELGSDGVTVLVPRAEFVTTCLDKWQCMQALKQHGIAIPETHLLSTVARAARYPMPYGHVMVVKPQTGRGSRGVDTVFCEMQLWQELAKRKNNPKGWLLQDYIDGPEYTVSVVCWRDNVVRAVVPKEIIAKHGMTRMAVTRQNERIDAVCRLIAKNLQPGGPFNVQLRVDEYGTPHVFEINPRFSGTVNLTIAAGCDEVGGLLEVARHGTEPDWSWREGVTLLRRYTDAVVDEADFASVEMAPYVT